MTLTTPTASPTGTSAAHHSTRAKLSAQFCGIRGQTVRLAEPLSPEDCTPQSMADASPVKWHLAHTTWFFETFILSEFAAGYEPYHPQFTVLFNSYYNQIGKRIARPNRGLMTRPSLDEVYVYRRQVDEDVLKLIEDADGSTLSTISPLIELGLQHEQQHQELILTDVKHLLSFNPLRPVYRERDTEHSSVSVPETEWIKFPGGMHEVGYDGSGFCYDNELPRHQVFLEQFALADRLITNGEFMEFMRDGGYQKPEHWLDMGWAVVKRKKWIAPLYWEKRDNVWWNFTLNGMRPVCESEPVTHVSLFEADAFARWAGVRLATEAEWEVASCDVPIEGSFVESEIFQPTHNLTPLQREANSFSQMFGDVWEWTRSQYSPYPGYAPPEGAIGEYNGKFMCNQFVLRGGSCATPQSHIRRTYRNFFPAEARWQFTGIRLAKDLK